MQNHFYKILITLLIISSIFAAGWMTLSRSPRHSTTNTTLANTNTAPAPDAWMEDVTILILNNQGTPSIRITTPRMTFFSEQDITHLTIPQVTIYYQPPQPWIITAQLAQAYEGLNQINFQQNVKINHLDDAHSPTTLIETNSLIVRPDQHTADTIDPITLFQPHITIKAVGMHADMSTGDIQLLSQTRGEYAPLH